MSDNDGFSSFLVGFIVGGLTGAVVSLLLAPQSGEETRAVLKDKAIELKDRASDTAEEAYARAEDAFADARVHAEEWAQIAMDRLEELQRRGQVVLEKQKSQMAAGEPSTESNQIDLGATPSGETQA